MNESFHSLTSANTSPGTDHERMAMEYVIKFEIGSSYNLAAIYTLIVIVVTRRSGL
jgi:hypothetical protein